MSVSCGFDSLCYLGGDHEVFQKAASFEQIAHDLFTMICFLPEETESKIFENSSVYLQNKVIQNTLLPDANC